MDSGMRAMGARGWRRQDAEILNQKLAKGTIRRIGRFARPYAKQIVVFILLVVVSALLVIASPLLFVICLLTLPRP